MATFFGEILPVTSRAVDLDDEDDEEDAYTDKSVPILQFSKKVRVELEKNKEKVKKLPCACFVLAIGVEANAFTEIYVKAFSYERIGGFFTTIKEDDTFTISQTSPTDKTCYIYRCHSNPNIIVCQCNRDVPAEQSYQWVQMLTDSIDLSTAYIAVLATSSTGGYCSDVPSMDLQTPFLRALKTEKFLASPICKILEQPNMLTGLPAQVMTFFQMYGYKAVIYVCFKENKYVDLTDVKAFLPTLKATPFKDMTEPVKNAEELLKDIVELHAVHDTLYM